MEAEKFLEIFVSKHLSVNLNNRSIDVFIYQCPKCKALAKTGGEFNTPVNFIAHLLSKECKDWISYVKPEVLDSLQNAQFIIGGIMSDIILNSVLSAKG